MVGGSEGVSTMCDLSKLVEEERMALASECLGKIEWRWDESSANRRGDGESSTRVGVEELLGRMGAGAQRSEWGFEAG
jgi:hypothetical protein